ncbi:HD domain-containing protein [bacterium]|nr:HD domain-containing protein [bacterium]
MITLEEVKSNKTILAFINQSSKALSIYHYTDHGIGHVTLVADRARELAKKVGLSSKNQELSAIAGFCHDMGNFLERKNHEYWGALLFQGVFQDKMPPKDLAVVMQAIANHDDYYAKILNPVAAVLILADKSDVRRSRVIVKDKKIIEQDIHNRVNFAVIDNNFKADPLRKRIILQLKIDTKFVPVMEYFEIFTERMVQCRKAAKFLDYKFTLIINNFKLL